MNFDNLLELLLDQNAAAWNPETKQWVEVNDSNINGIWVNYLLSFMGGARYDIWNNANELYEVAWSITQLKEELKKIGE